MLMVAPAQCACNKFELILRLTYSVIYYVSSFMSLYTIEVTKYFTTLRSNYRSICRDHNEM